MSPQASSTGKSVQVVSFSLKRELLQRFNRRVPRYGDKSKVVSRLVEMFLDGQVNVVLPARKL